MYFRSLSIFFICTNVALAWSNYFALVNNFNFPLQVTIAPTFSSVNNLCGGGLTNILLNSHSSSCEFEFTTSQKNIFSAYENNGTITVAKASDPNSFCTYTYSYSYQPIPYNYFEIHSENVALAYCQGSLHENEITLVNDHVEALPRIFDLGLLTIFPKAPQMTESIAVADCGNHGDNCLIASPDLQTIYQANGSSLQTALSLQNQLDLNEPLNFEQMLGSHNAAISHIYSTSTDPYNLSHFDPDNYLSVTAQLDAGIRLIELDILWHDNIIKICHDSPQLDPAGKSCDGNATFSSVLDEIKVWIKQHPEALLFLYLDVHMPLSEHVANLDQDLNILSDYIFTPAMANKDFGVNDNTLPAFLLSAHRIINHYHKNIILTNDDDVNNLVNSQYVFVHVQNTASTPLYENGIDTMIATNTLACDSPEKYTQIAQGFSADPEHFNLLRLNAARTTINYVTSVKDRNPEDYNNYFTSQNIAQVLQCPINIFSTSMLGYTCNDSACTKHPTDPRLAQFLWSWELGYPLQDGSDIAYLNLTNGHIQNDSLTDATLPVLCVKTSNQSSPVAPLQWFVENASISKDLYAAASTACKNYGGVFAVPTTSYWMSDVMAQLSHFQNHYVLVNYRRLNKEWVANAGGSLLKH